MLLFQTAHVDVLAYLCRRKKDKVLVMLNLGKQVASFEIDHPAARGDYFDLFDGAQTHISKKCTYYFQPGEFKVYHITHKYTE